MLVAYDSAWLQLHRDQRNVNLRPNPYYRILLVGRKERHY